jgi:hypothetical protein
LLLQIFPQKQTYNQKIMLGLYEWILLKR